jgi:biotin transporter BioY
MIFNIPFIAVDLIKAFIAAGITNVITPKTSYAKEIDIR